MVAIPDGPADMICPLHQKPMAKVCRKCPMWLQSEMTVTKMDGTTERVTDWVCGYVKNVFLQVEIIAGQKEIIRRLLGNQGATEGLRNEIVKRMERDSQQAAQLDLIDAVHNDARLRQDGTPKLIGSS